MNQTNNTKYCVIVDAFSTGKLLAPEIISRGFKCLHVESSDTIPYWISNGFRPQDFAAHFLAHKTSFENLVAELKKYPIVAVMPGAESSVRLADQLAVALNVVNNGLALSPARRNKYEMAEALKRAGVRSIPHIKSDNLDEILSNVKSWKLWPVVMKPLDSAGSDNVFICKKESDLIKAFNSIITSEGQLIGGRRSTALVQPFIKGTEYIVNTASCQGKHAVTDIWLPRKKSSKNGDFIYDTMELLPREGSIQNELVAYIFTVLDALGIQYGAGHSEVMMTQTGPVLIETGARVMGTSQPPSIHKACLGYSQVELVCDAYLAPEVFFQKTNGREYHLEEPLLYVSLTCPDDNLNFDEKTLTKIKTLKSFKYTNISGHDRLRKTTNLWSAAGYILLANKDIFLVHSDYQKIRNFEKSALYRKTVDQVQGTHGIGTPMPKAA